MFQPAISTISNKWQIVIPKQARSKIKAVPKDKVWVRALGPKKLEVEIIGPDLIEAAFGILADGSGRSWAKELVRERRKDAKEEEAKLSKFGA